MRRIFICLFLITSMLAWAEPKAGLLPKVFAGWQAQNIQSSKDPAAADSAHPDLLKEYGFKEFESADYTKPDRKMTVRVARFNDATGAYGAFTFYKSPEMATETIGDQASSNNERVLFYRGNVLVDVKLDRVTVTSAGELRELSDDIPLPSGGARNPPIIPAYLPKQGYVKNSAKYVVGTIGLSKADTPVPANLIDFNTGAEVAVGQYSTGEGTAQLTLISYPTPALAGNALRGIEAWHPAGSSPGTSLPVFAKRTGPIVAVMTGPVSEGEAKSLLASVNYDADVTWNQATKLTKNENIGSMLVNIIILISIILGLSLVAGLAFGGFRIMMKRMFPDRVFDRSQDVEIIRLDIGK